MSDDKIGGNADENIKASQDIEIGANITSVSNGKIGGGNDLKSSPAPDVTVLAISESKAKIFYHRNFISFSRIHR